MTPSHSWLPSRRAFLKGSAALGATHAMPRLVMAKTQDGFFDLRATKTAYKLAGASGPGSNLWLYNGMSPGPEIRVTKGDTVRVRFTNELDAPTSIHWHGIRIDNSMDGVAGLTQDPVQPGKSFDYVFKVPDAGTFWYHAHNKSWVHVARGLYGPLIVDEPVPLLDRDHDITLMVDDWRLDDHGRFDLASLGDLLDWTHAGRVGNWLTTNGLSEPIINLNKNETYRLRFINAANARIIQIDPRIISGKIIGYDGFVFDRQRDPSSLPEMLMPAQRVDILVTPQKTGTFRMNDVGEFGLLELMQGRAQSLAIFKVQDTKEPLTISQPVLSPNEMAIPDLDSAKQFELVMEGGAMGRMREITYQGKKLKHHEYKETRQFWSFNGIANLADDPLFSIERGKTVVIRTINQTGWPHGMHLHGHHFQVINIGGKVPDQIDWRDTFTIHGHEEVDIAFVADNPGKWLLHCHMLEHAAAGMSTWINVT